VWLSAACALPALALVALGALQPALAASPGPEVWYAPGDETPDYVDMFTHPERWSRARSQISVFGLGPPAAMGANRSGINTSMDLARVDAFRLLRSWGLKVALGVPAVKEWDCSGQLEIKRTLQYVTVVRQSGGDVDLLDMDEPLVGGVLHCHDEVGKVVQETAAYIAAIHSALPNIQIGYTEAYPIFSVAQIEAFVADLQRNGVKLAFFHLDVNIPVLPIRPQIHLEPDLRALQAFFRQQHVPFGIVIWSGYNPVHSDEAYYANAMAWVKRVHAAIGAPDQVIFASWVTRSSQQCVEGQKDCSREAPKCSVADPPYCGKKSIPINLPDNDPTIFSATRLVLDGIRLFETP